jgi:pseudouridine synthase
VEKVYTVRLEGGDIPGAVKKLRGVLPLEDGPAKAKRVRLLRDDGARALLEITVTEGRNHLVRNLCAAAGLEVKRLIRLSEGGLRLGELRTGCWRPLTEEELEQLFREAGLGRP